MHGWMERCERTKKQSKAKKSESHTFVRHIMHYFLHAWFQLILDSIIPFGNGIAHGSHPEHFIGKSSELLLVFLSFFFSSMPGVVVLKNLLSDKELESLAKDCTQASKRFTTLEQYAETSCGMIGYNIMSLHYSLIHLKFSFSNIY